MTYDSEVTDKTELKKVFGDRVASLGSTSKFWPLLQQLIDGGLDAVLKVRFPEKESANKFRMSFGSWARARGYKVGTRMLNPASEGDPFLVYVFQRIDEGDKHPADKDEKTETKKREET